MRHVLRFPVTRWYHRDLLLSSDSCALAVCTRPQRGSRFCRLLTALEKDQQQEAGGGSAAKSVKVGELGANKKLHAEAKAKFFGI